MNQITKTICLLLFCCPGLYAAEVLERHIDVRFQQTPLKEALAVVAQKAGFEWSYNANIVDGTKRISLVANDWTVRETLYELLGDGYEFKSNGQYLILKKRKKPTEQLSGYIKDASGQRVANATIYDRRTLRATTTDSNGYYELRVKKSTEITVARLNYRDTIFPVTSTSPRFQKVDLQVDNTPMKRGLTLEENLQKAATQIERLFQISLEKWNALNVPDSLHRRYQVSFLPKLGTNHTLSGKVVNDWSLNILAGTSLGNRKVEIGGIGNFNRKNMTGVQVGGVFNELRGNADGLQIAGIYNRVGDTLQGIQVGGLVNIAHQTAGRAIQVAGMLNQAPSGETPIQIGGIGNRAAQISTVQVGGIYNHVSDTLRGIQVAGLINRAQQPTGQAIQIAGIVNRASGGKMLVQIGGISNRATRVSGLQMAGLNNSVDTIEGVQVAGLINRARKVKGVQFGLFNYAREVHGLQIGLLNRSGRRVLPFFNW